MQIYALVILILLAMAIIAKPEKTKECERCKAVRRQFEEKQRGSNGGPG